ncbi:MAG: CDP-alcohol phosphatidyltransferase family protein [Chloroflexi bacterium]|nr:CDP-alcohol phosphatidyltransferase family protein [Chloroflexota bacterium]
MIKLDSIRKSAAHSLTRPAVQLLAMTRITPNIVTWCGLGLAVTAAALIGAGNLLAGGLVVLAGGFFDMLDGALARHTRRTSRFGGVLDSTLDRLADALPLIGIIVFYVLSAPERPVVAVLLAGASMIGSFLVSYVKARMEADGLECKVGLFTRTERVIVLALGLILYQVSYALVAALAVTVFFSFFTVGQRLIEAWHQTKTDVTSGK